MINYNAENPIEEPHLRMICEFSNIDENQIRNFKISNSNKKKRLWTIFGTERDKEGLKCLQVGSSNNIVSEIREILRAMISIPEKKLISTRFHEDVYEFTTYVDKASVKYRHIYERYNTFILYEIEVEGYLKDVDIKGYDKVNYAEVKFAFDNKALLWNEAPPTKGNKEREILYNYFVPGKQI